MRRFALLLFFLVLATAGSQAQLQKRDAGTNWELKPSMKYDVLCLLNVLSGDPYYLHYYQGEFDHFHHLFTPEENAAFVQLKRILKDEGGGIVSARLALYYSVVNDETLPEMIRTAQDSSAMEAALKKTPYWDDSEWNTYEKARPAVQAALRALDRVGFPEYWKQSAEPAIAKRIAELSPTLAQYDIVPVIERYLGFSLPSRTITVYLLAYSEPHGIRITGLRFLTHESYPFRIVLHNAIHEPMHPPYDAKDARVRKAIDLLSKDPLIVDKVTHHDASFGYNAPAGYIDEDSVEALEQIVAEQFGVGRDPREYWKEQDGGIHVLAAAIYVGYKAAIQRSSMTYTEWFVHAVESGELRGDKLEATIHRFFAETPPKRNGSN